MILPALLLMKDSFFSSFLFLPYSNNISFAVINKLVFWIGKFRKIAVIIILLVTVLFLYSGSHLIMSLKESNLLLYDSNSINTENQLISEFGISSNSITFIYPK